MQALVDSYEVFERDESMRIMCKAKREETMPTEEGEHLVGAYLQLVEGCDFVIYNARLPDIGTKGQGEVDVVGLRNRDKRAFICEVTTHLYGMDGYPIKKVKEKLKRDRDYAEKMLADFQKTYQWWSPIISKGRYLQELQELVRSEDLKDLDLKLVVNDTYKERIRKLIEKAGKIPKNTGNPAFRILQIMARIKLVS